MFSITCSCILAELIWWTWRLVCRIFHDPKQALRRFSPRDGSALWLFATTSKEIQIKNILRKLCFTLLGTLQMRFKIKTTVEVSQDSLCSKFRSVTDRAAGEMEKIKILIVLLSLGSASSQNDFTSTPVVLWHGMGEWNRLVSQTSRDFSQNTFFVYNFILINFFLRRLVLLSI